MSLGEEFKASTDANKHLMAHTERVLRDVATAYRGISHSVNHCNAEYADCWAKLEGVLERLESLEAKHEALFARLKAKFSEKG